MRNRQSLIDELDWMYNRMHQSGLGEKAESILYKHNASEKDDDPIEGFMVTMTDHDLEESIKDMKREYNLKSIDTTQDYIYSLTSGEEEVSREYATGFLDACKMISREYDIDLDI